MDTARQIREILATEVAVHQTLLRLARTRHLLLRQGRMDEAGELGMLEAAHIMVLCDLEDRRGRFPDSVPAVAQTAARARRRIAALVRSLGAVERANAALLERTALAAVPALRPAPARAGAINDVRH